MRFGAFVPQGWKMDLQGQRTDEQWSSIRAVARRIEREHYESLWVYDHFHTVPRPTLQPTYEAWTLMAALAAVTDTVRLGQMCTCNGYRPPSYLAKVAANVDVISGGRLEFAIGAGWYEQEFNAYGYEFPKASVRIGQLRESVEIIKAMWTSDDASYQGTYYHVDGAINQPAALQDPHPPIWIAGGGEKLTLRLVAEHADYANFHGDIATFRHKSQVLADHCEAVGRDFGEVGRTYHPEVVVAENETALDAVVGRVAAQREMAPDAYRAAQLVGTPEQVVERLAAYDEAGCVYTICYFGDAAWGDSIEVFAERVMPHLAS
ncbi:MAG: LLM class F420-dependent oxidoreductase [Acidimicrobiia bacterium]